MRDSMLGWLIHELGEQNQRFYVKDRFGIFLTLGFIEWIKGELEVLVNSWR
jgi:hypothetical protein